MFGHTKLHNKGFTLIELLIVVSLVGIIFLAVYGALSGGVRIWKRISEDERTGDLMLARKRLQKDLRSQFRYKAIPLVGGENEVSFAALVSVKEGREDGKEDGEGTSAHDEVGRIRYYSDGSCKCLCREKLTYVDVMKGKAGECLPVFSSVALASFEYYGRETDKEGPGAWHPEWRRDFPPLAVRLKVTLEEGGGKIEKQFTTLLP